MIKNLKNGAAAVSLGIAMALFSGSAFSAPGPVTYLWYYANYYTLLVTAGGVSCGMTVNNAPAANIAGVISILAAAKANGTNVSLDCTNDRLQINMH